MGSDPINYRAVYLKFQQNYGEVVFSHYVMAPLGILVLLLFAYLTDMVIDLLPFTFPAQSWKYCTEISPDFLFHHVHTFLHPAAEFLLACMGLFFTSSFVLIPRQDVMPGKDIGLIAALFLPSLLLTWVGTVMIAKAMAYVWPLATADEPDKDNNADVLKGSDSESTRRSWKLPNRPLTDIKVLSPTAPAFTPTVTEKNSQKVEPTAVEKPLSPEERLAKQLEVWFDPAVYFLLLLIGIPLYFSPGGEKRGLPLFTGAVSLAWLFSKRTISASYQKVFHPILVTSFITVFLPLNHYSTGANYLIIFRTSAGWNGSSPGAGDLLSSLLVGGIVALAFPMFRYRADLYNNFFRIFVVVLPNCVVSLLFWPWVAAKMGMSGDRAITFAARFMSTPFGIQFIFATGGDSSLVVVLICITGIFAVIVRDPLFKLCRTRTTPGSDDYFTIGCTIGIIAAAIGTSSLMTSHSRAAATSTVTFVVYGLALLALVAVPLSLTTSDSSPASPDFLCIHRVLHSE
ncbi:hypothetical protein H4Q26_012723 [Puccinia striiformis f. sp. tritici PST-130]|nr:hypothetical protein H4Q26_012723 [Puccinia striiformis f. sp. tritici PST-130]